MERLTNHFYYCDFFSCPFYNEELAKENKCKYFDLNTERCHEKAVYEKLAHYEDLEEQGLLPRFHLGDEFWTTMIDRVVKAKVVMLQQKKDGSWIYRLSCEITKDYHDTINYEERKYGKCFFDTKEEAEAKLQELQNGVTQSNDGVKEGK